MTGFGSADVALSNGRVIAEIRSVNARTLDIRVKLPEPLSDLALWAEQLIRKRVVRGRVEATARLEGSASIPIEIDRVRAESAFGALRQLRDALDPTAPLPLSLLGAVPGIFVPKAESIDELRRATQAALEGALSALDAAKEREGDATLRDLLSRRQLVIEARARVAKRAESLPSTLKERLTARLSRADVIVDPARLEAEVVLAAERSDVSEELVRLAAHLEHFTTIVDSGPERTQGGHASGSRAGRALDFLLQEMLREVGTLGAKAQDQDISHDVVRMKVELERMREQVQNVE